MNQIGFVSRRFLPAEGGIEHFLGDLLSALRRNYAPRVAAQILGNGPDYPGMDDCFAGGYADGDFEGLPVKALTPGLLDRLRLLPCAFKLLPGLRRYAYSPLKALAVRRTASVYEHRLRVFFQDAALIHSFAFDGPGLAACRAASRLKVPFVITPFAHPGRWGDSPQNIRLYNSADAVIALHTEDAQALLRMGVNGDLIRECGVGLRPFTGNGPRFRAKHSIPGPMILFIGRMVEHKGYRELIRAVSRLRAENRDITLVLMGPAGFETKKFLDEQRTQGILFLGETTEAEKRDALLACDLFALPSDSEIMPVTLLEAWWAGKPVLAGDIPPLRAFVEENVTGVFAKRDAEAIREKLFRFLSAPDHFRSMGEKGRETVEAKYLIQTVAERMTDIYIEALQGKKDVTRIHAGHP